MAAQQTTIPHIIVVAGQTMTMPIARVVWQNATTYPCGGEAKDDAAYHHGGTANDNGAYQRGGSVDNNAA
jgi:hypothetical protein